MSNEPYGRCWSCDEPLNEYVFFCTKCLIVQPPREGSAFCKFSLSEVFEIEISQLDRVYFERQAKLHPDKFVGKSDLEKLYSLQQSADLNAAYEILKNPITRAAHLLTLMGEEDVLADQTIHDIDLLAEIMERQENLEKTKSRQEVTQLRKQTCEDICQIEKDLAHDFKKKNVSRAKQSIHRLKYLSKFLKQCDDKFRNLGYF